MIPRKTTFTELVVKGLLLFSIFTVLQGVSVFDSINRLWLVAVSAALIFRLLLYSYTPVEILVLATTVFLHLIALWFTDFPMYNINMLFYFALWVIMCVFFAKSKWKILQVLRNSKTYINAVLWVWTALVGVTALMPSCYNGSYFVSLTDSSFRLMPATLIITALAMYMIVSRNDNRYYLFLLLPTYAAFMNQSRTYFGMYLLFLLMFVYMRTRSVKIFILLMVPAAALILFAFMHSGIAEKLEEAWLAGSQSGDFWFFFTSGRTEFWLWDIEAFLDLPVWQQFVGNGFDFAFEVTDAHGYAIWAHNDIINILMNFGYIGAVIYVWAYLKLVGAFLSKNKAIPRLVKLLFHLAVFINSMWNMSYTYFCAVISYTLFLCVILEQYGEADRGANTGEWTA